MSQPDISIVLPTLNAAETISKVLDALARQKVDFSFETVAVDSGSADGTLSLLKRVDKLIEISPHEFNHGLTRNLGIEHARGKLVVLLVQDAIPTSNSWLTELTAPFESDDRLAGTFARQIPLPEASPVTRQALSRWAASQEEPQTRSVASPDAFQALSPEARFQSCVFDNVCSCVRRRVWEKYPFRPTPIAEDLEWAKEVLLAGYRLAYLPSAAVVHSHERSLRYEFERTHLVHQRLHELFELRTIPSLPSLLRSVAITLFDHADCLRRSKSRRANLAEIFRTFGLAFVWPLGQYLGGHVAARDCRRRKGEGPS